MPEYLAREIIDGEEWVQLPDGRWGVLENLVDEIKRLRQPGICLYCGHHHQRVKEHELICRNLTLCPETVLSWRDQNSPAYKIWVQETFGETWSTYGKPVCDRCFSRKYLSFRSYAGVPEPAGCEDCGSPADHVVELPGEPGRMLVDYMITRPSEGLLVKVDGIEELLRTGAELVKSLRKE